MHKDAIVKSTENDNKSDKNQSFMQRRRIAKDTTINANTLTQTQIQTVTDTQKRIQNKHRKVSFRAPIA